MTERTIQFGPSREMVGTLCFPESGRAVGTTGLLLLNAGIVHRIGPHRINVRLAREAAALGLPSLRFDLSGRGDSLPASPARRYDEQAALDVVHAVGALCDEARCDRVMLFGICSGADDGFAAALSEPRLASLVLFDPPIFPTLRWRARVMASKLRKYGIRGSIARAIAIRRTMSIDSGAEDNYGRDVPPVREYAARLAQLADRGARVRLVYSGSTCDEADYQAQRRLVLGREGLSGRIQTEFLPDIDHVVTTRRAQELLVSRFREWLADPAGTG